MLNVVNLSLLFGLFIYGLGIFAVVLGLVYLYRINKTLQEISRKMNSQDQF